MEVLCSCCCWCESVKAMAASFLTLLKRLFDLLLVTHLKHGVQLYNAAASLNNNGSSTFVYLQVLLMRVIFH